MKYKFRIIIFILIIMVFASMLLSTNPNISKTDSVTIVISLAALLITVVSAFKNELFPHEIRIFADGIHLVRAGSFDSAVKNSIQVLLPITFFNVGYGECILEKLRIKVFQKKTEKQYIFNPSLEIDMPLFYQQIKGINASNTLGSFTGFLLESRKGIKKSYVFSPQTDNSSAPFVWMPSEYRFVVEAKILGKNKFKEYFKFEKEITKNILLFVLHKALSVYLM